MTLTTAGYDAGMNGTKNKAQRARGKRRTFDAQFKKKVLDDAASAEHGQVGAVLRKHGVNHGHLRDWRQQYDSGGMAALAGKSPSAAK